MSSNEEYVRARWQSVSVTDWYAGTSTLTQAWSIWLPCGWTSPVGGTATDAEMWSAARAFTEQREQAIANVEDEIEWLNWPSVKNVCTREGDLARCRIIAREQAALAELQRGLRP